jgi:hypothetical protein
LHPSGKRDFTNRELARLQSFPDNHVFYGVKGSVRKQIGNAVPPIFARKLYETIIATLRATDAAEAAKEAAQTAAATEDVGHEVGLGNEPDDAIMLD